MDPSKVDSKSAAGEAMLEHFSDDIDVKKAAADVVINRAVSLYAAAEMALKKCGSARHQVSDELFTVPEKMLKAEIEKLHGYKYSDAKPPPTTEKDILLGAIQRLEEAVEKKDEEIKLLAELLRRSQDELLEKEGQFKAGFRTLKGNYYEILQMYGQTEWELGHARSEHAKIRKDYQNYLQNMSVMIPELSSEITSGTEGHEPKKQRKQ